MQPETRVISGIIRVHERPLYVWVKQPHGVTKLMHRHREEIGLGVSHFVTKPPVFLVIKVDIAIGWEKSMREYST